MIEHLGEQLVAGAPPDEALKIDVEAGCIEIFLAFERNRNPLQLALQRTVIIRRHTSGGFEKGLLFQRRTDGDALSDLALRVPRHYRLFVRHPDYQPEPLELHQR